jgi:hypothetical protein
MRETHMKPDAKTALGKALETNRGTKAYYKTLVIYWPNVQQNLERLAFLLGNEIRCPDKKTLFLTSVLVETRKYIKQSEKKGCIRFWCRDRDILVYFYRGLCRQVARINGCRVSADGESWEPPDESFIPWRQKHPGKLQVVWNASDPSEQQIRDIAESILTERDEKILKDDVIRIWTDPDPVMEKGEEAASAHSRKELYARLGLDRV